jgi:uncharacterized SAM-binding protein YcdF (DUF218 family)
MFFWPVRWAFRIVSAVVLLLVLYFGVTFVQIWLTGRQHTSNNAQAILVFGTAEDNGRPSQELQDRLNQALALFNEGRAPYVAVTGGRRPGDVYTEAGVSATYLEARGVPSTQILVGGGSDTWENVSSVVPALRTHHITTVITVTDAFHEYRAMAIASDQGLTPYPYPVSNSPIHGPIILLYYGKETLEVGIARFIGFHTLSNWIHGD